MVIMMETIEIKALEISAVLVSGTSGKLDNTVVHSVVSVARAHCNLSFSVQFIEKHQEKSANAHQVNQWMVMYDKTVL